MSCSQPSRLYPTGMTNAETGKESYIYERFKKYINEGKPSVDLFSRAMKNNDNFIEVPCGSCENCKADQAYEKAFRMMAEDKSSTASCVVNLTYDDVHMPKVFEYDVETGEVLSTFTNTLFYPDVQAFKKRLQRHFKYKYNEDNIRSVVAGEYGDQYGRPHYHIVFYNLDIRDLVYRGKTKNGSDEYTSETISKLWGKGFVTIGDFSRETAQYVSNYILKKIKGGESEAHYKGLGKRPEFVISSRKPGIGADWLINHIEDYKKYGKLVIGTNSGLMELHSCQYLDRIIAEQDPEEAKRLKEAKSNLAKMREEFRAQLSNVPIEELRETRAKEFHSRIKYAKHKRKFT